MKCRLAPVLLLAAALCWECASSRKMAEVRDGGLSAAIRLPREKDLAAEEDIAFPDAPRRDTLKVTGLDGKEVFIMKAIRDEGSGDMVATEQLDAAMVTARFRNIAERNGRVDLEFQVIVPPQMTDSKWQLRLHPTMKILSDSLALDDVVVTGSAYRKAQLRGYEHYRRFLDRIITDTLKLIDMRNLEIFLARNIPAVYAFKSDSSYVSDSEFESAFGVTQAQAVEHYTNGFLVWRNGRLKSMREKMWRRYVKTPIVTEGIRLDTVLVGSGGEFIYNYVQTIHTRPKLRKVDVTLCGEIFESDRQLYTVPQSPPLTFYISSVSTFADGTPRYLTKIISRNVQTNTTSYIDFRTGSAEVDERLSDNGREIAAIRRNLRELIQDESFELDSIVIVASASPEGRFKSNASLSYRRSEGVSEYFSNYVEYIKDSLRHDDGLFISVGDDMGESPMGSSLRSRRDIRFLSRSGGENWQVLDALVEKDTVLTSAEREYYFSLAGMEDLDAREAALRKSTAYRYVSDSLYPRLRTVRFNFCLHRRGMQKDTVHTTVIDSVYMRGVQALRDHDYEGAIALLSPYQDYNTAVACVALDRNTSALNILQGCRPGANVNYLLAIVHSRQGRERDAVECYLRSCSQDPSLVHRGNLDPEISALIRKYDLNKEEDIL